MFLPSGVLVRCRFFQPEDIKNATVLVRLHDGQDLVADVNFDLKSRSRVFLFVHSSLSIEGLQCSVGVKSKAHRSSGVRTNLLTVHGDIETSNALDDDGSVHRGKGSLKFYDIDFARGKEALRSLEVSL